MRPRLSRLGIKRCHDETMNKKMVFGSTRTAENSLESLCSRDSPWVALRENSPQISTSRIRQNLHKEFLILDFLVTAHPAKLESVIFNRSSGQVERVLRREIKC